MLRLERRRTNTPMMPTACTASWRTCLGVLLAFCLLGCGGGNGGPLGPVPSDLIAAWEADRRCVPSCALHIFTTTTPPDSLNLLTWDYFLALHIARNGDFRLRFGMGRDSVVQGNVRAEGNRLILSSSSTVADTLFFSVQDPLLQLVLPNPLRIAGGGQHFDAPLARAVLLRR
jgi:hypothetical protein